LKEALGSYKAVYYWDKSPLDADLLQSKYEALRREGRC
jgi:hypothetical protein